MLKTIKKNYFQNRNYPLIYAHHFLHNIVTAAMYIFTGAYFLKLGMPLHFVLLFYGLEFGIRGLLCPFGLAFLNKIGLIKAQFVSALFLILFFIGISFSEQNLIIGFSSLLLAAIGGAIYYPFLDVLEALYIDENKNRTKQISLGLVFGSLGKVVGAVTVGLLLSKFGFNSVLIFASIASALSVLPFIWMQDKNKQNLEIKPVDIYKFLIDDKFKPLWKPFFGEQLVIIVRAVMVPIFIYSIIGKMDVLGYLIAIAFVGEKILTLIAGHYTDKLGVSKAIRFSTISHPLAMSFYIFLAKTPFTIFLAESLHKTVLNIYGSAFRSGIHTHIRSNYPNNIMLFGTGWQMALCFGELLVLPLYALLSYFIGINIFYVSCVIASIGIWIINDYFRKEHISSK